MDFLTQHQLKKYEKIIEQIQSEHEKSERLQSAIKSEENRIVFHKLSQSNKLHKLAHLNVKVFSDIVELYHLYNDELNCDISALAGGDNKFYLIEIYIPPALQNHLQSLTWFLTISVQNEYIHIYRTIHIKSATPIIEVLPIDETIRDSEVSLILNVEANTCIQITLDTVKIDISYHFQMNKPLKKQNKNKDILQLTKNYKTNLDIVDLQKPIYVDYQFLTKMNNKEFVNAFIQNSYHTMDLELFSELINESNSVFSLKFITGSQKHSVSYDRASHIITLRSSVQDLVHLKKYFCSYMVQESSIEDNLKQNIKDMMLITQTSLDKEKLELIYVKLRRLWT